MKKLIFLFIAAFVLISCSATAEPVKKASTWEKVKCTVTLSDDCPE